MTNSPTKKSSTAATPAPAPAIDSNTLAAAFATFTQMHAQMQSQNPTPAPTATTNRTFPAIPTFRPDLAKANYASTWFAKLESLFRLQTFTDGEKCALAVSALDESAFEEVARALLPDKIQALTDFAKLQTTMIKLYDRSESVFAKRYAAFNMEWKGPEYESPASLAARVRQQVGAMDCTSFNHAAVETMCMLLAMKHPALESFRMQILNLLTKDPATSMDTCVTAMDTALQTHRDQRLVVNPNINYVQVKKAANPSSSPRKGEKQRASCLSCGADHDRRSCKFKDAVCNFCHISGHIEKVCRKRANNSRSFSDSGTSNASNSKPPSRRPNIHNIRVDEATPTSSSFSNARGSTDDYCGYRLNNIKISPPPAAKSSSSTKGPSLVKVCINGTPLVAQLDDEADIALLCLEDYDLCGRPKFFGPSLSAVMDDTVYIQTLGSFKANVVFRDKLEVLEFHVADISMSRLGLDFYDHYNINSFQISDIALAPSVAQQVLQLRSNSSSTSPHAVRATTVSTVAKAALRPSSITATDAHASTPTISNVVACRPPSTSSTASSNPAVCTTKAHSAITFADAAAVFLSTQHPAISNDVIKEYESDGYAKTIMACLSNGATGSRYSLVNGLIIISNRLYVPAKLRPRVSEILLEAYNNALAPEHCSGVRFRSDAEKKP
uniref:Gag protein n=1 Tax=Panagrolaimus davidi TaxID=227884 RepID=A0A914Q3R8_9BILA